MDEVEKLSRRRSRLLMVSAGAFLAWQIPMMDRVSNWDGSGVQIISLIGFLVWAGALVALLIFGRTTGVKDKGLRAALNDELTQHNRAKAFSTGYWVMLIAAGGLLALAQFQPVSGAEAAHILVVLAVVAPCFRFALLERG